MCTLLCAWLNTECGARELNILLLHMRSTWTSCQFAKHKINYIQQIGNIGILFMYSTIEKYSDKFEKLFKVIMIWYNERHYGLKMYVHCTKFICTLHIKFFSFILFIDYCLCSHIVKQILCFYYTYIHSSYCLI